MHLNLTIALDPRSPCWCWPASSRRACGGPAARGRAAGGLNVAVARRSAERRPSLGDDLPAIAGRDCRAAADRTAGSRGAAASLRLDALIDAHRRRCRSKRRWRRAGAGASAPTRRVGSKPFMIEGLEQRDRRMGNPRAGRALRRIPGRRAARQPQRRAQRDRVLRVRAEDRGASPRASAPRPTCPTCSSGGARARARRVREPARCPARGHAARARRVAWSVGYLSSRPRATASWPASCPGGWCCRRPTSRRTPPVLTLGFDAAGRAVRRPRSGRACASVARASTWRRPRAAEPFAAWHGAARRRSPTTGRRHRRRPGAADHAAASGHRRRARRGCTRR